MQQSAGTIQLKLYEDGVNYCGVAKVKLPSIAYMCTNLAGVGMMGNLEVPYIGMIDNMTTEIDWQSPTGDAVKLMSPKKHQLDMRVVEEYWDTEETDVDLWPDKYVMIVRPKTLGVGDVAPMTAANTSGEYAVYYYAAYRDGKQLWEIDKRNQKFVVNGKDYWAKVRKALGE